MKLIPSREAASCASTQDFSKFFETGGPTFFETEGLLLGVDKSRPLLPILRQISPVHTTLPCLFNIHFNIIYPPTSCSL
jgi:hypothetical protein